MNMIKKNNFPTVNYLLVNNGDKNIKIKKLSSQRIFCQKKDIVHLQKIISTTFKRWT